MDTSLFVSILNKIEIPKKEIIDAMGMSYTGFDLAVKNNTMKVKSLEQFCIKTGTHISEFFPNWIINNDEKMIPHVVQDIQENYQSNYNSSCKEVLQAKDELIAELKSRNAELSELVAMFKSGKIKLTD